MADVQAVQQPQEIQAGVATGNQQATAAVNAGEDKYGSLERTLQELRHQVNGLSAALRVKAKEQPDPQPTQEQTVTLRSLKSELDARDAKIKEKAIRTEVNSFAKQAGLPAESVPFFNAYVREQYGSKLTTNDQDEVVWTDELGDVKPFSMLGQKILSSAGGQSLLPPMSTPGGVGQRRMAGSAVRTSVPDLSQMSVEEMMKNPALADEAARNMAAMIQQSGTVRT